MLKRNPCACDPDVGMNRKAAGPDGISAQNLLYHAQQWMGTFYGDDLSL